MNEMFTLKNASSEFKWEGACLKREDKFGPLFPRADCLLILIYPPPPYLGFPSPWPWRCWFSTKMTNTPQIWFKLLKDVTSVKCLLKEWRLYPPTLSYRKIFAFIMARIPLNLQLGFHVQKWDGWKFFSSLTYWLPICAISFPPRTSMPVLSLNHGPISVRFRLWDHFRSLLVAYHGLLTSASVNGNPSQFLIRVLGPGTNTNRRLEVMQGN